MFYKTTVEFYIARLQTLKTLLETAQKQSEERKIAEDVVLGLRLAPDMFSLCRQVQITCDNAKMSSARLAGIEAPKNEDTETTFAQLQARIDSTLAFLSTLKESDFAEAASRKIELKYFPDMHFTGEGYLISYAIPNFMFHATAVYMILRANGYNVGKKDFAGNLPLHKNNDAV